MKMCLAPCFKGCTDEAYAAEVARVQAYLDSGGHSLVAEMEAEREHLSATLDFEAAAQQHAKIAKVKGILSGCDEICRRLDQIDAVIIQPARAETGQTKSVALFRFRQGELAGPHLFAVESENESSSLEQRVRETLREFQPAGARSAVQFVEELAILKRWYYRTHKVGEMVQAKPDGSWPLRKLAICANRVSRGEKQPADSDPTLLEPGSPLPGPSISE
jgi:excinuclease UvrABC nuclease subunit